MKRILPLLLCTVLVASVALAEDPPPPPAEGPAPDAKPAPTASVPDLCKGVVDPFNAGEERSRFFRAAGVDSDLSAKEAEANRKASRPFVRKFDHWKVMASHDKSRDGQLDWYEALEYRKTFRKVMIAAFDGNKDGRLAGKERIAANRALASGKVPSATAGAAADRSQIYIPDRSGTAEGGAGGGGEGRGGFGGNFRERIMGEHDKNGDGELDEEERAAMRDAWQKRMEEWQQKRELDRYDKDGDGQLNDAEQAEADKARAEREERMKAWRERMAQRRAEWTKQWDADGDGELNEEERAAMREGMAERGAQMGRQIGEMLGGLTDR